MKKAFVVLVVLLLCMSFIGAFADQDSDILVVVFSCTGNTKPLAEYAAELLGADLYEIEAAQPYTEADLAYYTGGRCDQEQDNPDIRPAIANPLVDIGQYSTIIIGHHEIGVRFQFLGLHAAWPCDRQDCRGNG